MRTPRAEQPIHLALVRRLLASQHPDLAGRPLRSMASGWDNAMFLLGDDLAVRLPRRTAAARLIRHEQRWLPVLAPRLPVRVPAPVRVGGPGQGYPWPWSVVPWLPGSTADVVPMEGAEDMAAFLMALHTPAPRGAPDNPHRGVPLVQRRAAIERRMEDLDGGIGPVAARAWARALEAAPTRAPRWIHGDLHPRNVLVDRGSLCGVIDWGDVTSGDVATDLGALWMLFESLPDRRRILDAYGADPTTRQRAVGWAVAMGVMLATITDDEAHRVVGQATLRRIEDGP